MADIEIQADKVTVERNGFGVKVKLEDINPKDIYATLEEEDMAAVLEDVPADVYAKARGGATFYGELSDEQKQEIVDSIEATEIVKRVSIGALLDEIGEAECIAHFKIKVAVEG